MYQKFLVFIMLILALGCQKNELKISSDFDCSKGTVEEREGATPVQVIDSTLIISSQCQ
jgi:hypothetical protein